MRAQNRGILWKSIAVGTLLGLFGPSVLYLVFYLLFGYPDDFRVILLRLLLLFGFPSFVSAVVGGYSAHFSKNRAIWPELLLAGISLAFWVMLLYYPEIVRFPVLLSIFWAANTWVSGWWSIRGVRQGRSLAIGRLVDYPPGYQDHFAVDRRPDDAASPHVQGSLQGFSDEPSNDTTEDESA